MRTKGSDILNTLIGVLICLRENHVAIIDVRSVPKMIDMPVGFMWIVLAVWSASGTQQQKS